VPPAFRPGARDWPSRALPAPDESGYERLFDLRLDGAPVVMAWPGSPDSSLGSVALPHPLEPGDSVVLAFGWIARPPALAWRRDRRGRRIDLAGWYPQVIDSTSRTTVAFPAFSTLRLELDLPADQVIGGTGVPLCGDPGWAGADVVRHSVGVPLGRRELRRRGPGREANRLVCRGGDRAGVRAEPGVPV
jgi:hypothetical protein